MAIKKDTLHPEGEPEIDIYPKTSIDQVENLQANLDALNGDIANVNGEIANISANVETIANKVGDINKDVSTLKYNDTNQDRRIQVLENTSGTTINRVEIAEKNITDLQNDVNQNIIDISDIKDDITVLNTAYGSYTDYTEVTNGFLLIYLSGKQIELPIKAGTNVTFSKYPGTNQIIINATGGSVPDNIAILNANNTFTGSNTFEADISIIPQEGNFCQIGYNNIYWSDTNVLAGFTWDSIEFHLIMNEHDLLFPNKTGTIALTSDIPNTSSFPTLAGSNNWTGSNIFDTSITTKGNLFVSNGITSYTVNAITRKGYIYTFPDDTGTFALTKNIPTRPQYLQGFGIGTPTYFSFETGIYHTLTITLSDSYKSISIIIPNDYDGSQIDLDIDGDYFEVTLENGKLSVKNTTRDILWLGKLE